MNLPGTLFGIARGKCCEVYLASASAVLILAAISKIIGLQQESEFLYKPNPLLSFIANRHLMFVVACLEVPIGILIVSRGLNLGTRIRILFWLSAQFAIYRLALLLSNEPEPCKCFGEIFGWLNLPSGLANSISWWLFLFLLIPSGLWVVVDGIGKKSQSLVDTTAKASL